MAEILFITPQEMTETTIIGGNVDVDRYTMCILNTQISTIEPLLGSILYNKIKKGLKDGDLKDNYLKIFNDFIKPITKYESCADYIAISQYSLTNAGLFKNKPENVEIVDKKEVEGLSDRYSSMAQMYVNRFNKWIKLNELPEYKVHQDEVDAMDINLNNGWRF
jgi:hypothetical protein